MCPQLFSAATFVAITFGAGHLKKNLKLEVFSKLQKKDDNFLDLKLVI